MKIFWNIVFKCWNNFFLELEQCSSFLIKLFYLRKKCSTQKITKIYLSMVIFKDLIMRITGMQSEFFLITSLKHKTVSYRLESLARFCLERIHGAAARLPGPQASGLGPLAARCPWRALTTLWHEAAQSYGHDCRGRRGRDVKNVPRR